MALVLQDRVREISTTTGTGTVTLSGAYPGGYRTFASCVPNGSTTYYCIHNTTNGVLDEWEVGLGTYSSNTLTRDTVLSSSNAGALVTFSAGDKEVFITYPAEKAIYEEADGQTLINGGPITVVGSNVTSLPALPAELGKFVGNIDLFAQIYNLNQSSGQNASADFVAYNSDTDANGTTFFVDMGINSPNYSSVDYPIFTPNSGYVFSLGDGGSNTSTLFLGSGDGDVRVFAGGLDTNNTVATFGTDLSTELAGALDVGATLNVSGVTTLNALAYTAGNIAAAANSTVLVTKQYVDDATSNGFHVHNPVLVATTGNLTASYNNGTSGVGATLTNSGAQAALSIDGVSMNVNDRVLVWQQTTGTQNGVYVVTTVGSGASNWVLTRSSDADTSSEGDPNSLGGGDYFFVQSGSTLAYHSFICTNTGTITFGTTAITFSEFSSVPAYVGGTNINVNGQTISLAGTVGPTNGGTGVNTVTTGDLLYGSGSNTWGKLGLGAANKALVVNGSGTQVEWNAVALGASGAVSGVLPEANGGTNNSTYVTGDTLYASGTNTLGKLGPNTTTTKKFLSQTGTGSAGQAPAWAQPAASDITGLAASATTDTTNADNISSGTLANARTTASSSNGASTIVARDASGNFSANTITANVTGNISGSAATLTTARNFQISGGATAANVSFDGSAAVNLNVTAMNASVINTGTIANIYTTASSSNGASTIVARDASGNFTANNVTATNIIASGSSLTSLNASAISSGTVPTARLASGTASNATYLRGDSTWAALTSSQWTTTGSDIYYNTGNVGIGTSSPSYKLDVAGLVSSQDAYLITANSSGTPSAGAFMYRPASNTLAFGTASTERLRIDSSGNLGLGVTPSAWNVGKTIELGSAVGNAVNGQGTNDLEIVSNAYYNSGFKFAGTGYANRLDVGSAAGAYKFFVSNASGTAGNAITWTQAMTLDASGRLGIGTTSPSFSLDVAGSGGAAIRGGQGFNLYNSDNTNNYYLYNSGSTGSGNAVLQFVQGGVAERMRIDSSGNVGIGTSSPQAKIDSSGSINITGDSGLNGTWSGLSTRYITGDNTTYLQSLAVSSGSVTSGKTLSLDGSTIVFRAINGSAFTEKARISTAGGFSVGTTADPGAGAIYATGNITAYYSDERLKTKVGNIENALDKVAQIETMVYHANETAVGLGYDASKIEVGVTAQSVQKVQPEAVKPAPIDEQYLTVQYERLVPLLIEAIKELKAEVAELKAK